MFNKQEPRECGAYDAYMGLPPNPHKCFYGVERGRVALIDSLERAEYMEGYSDMDDRMDWFYE